MERCWRKLFEKDHRVEAENTKTKYNNVKMPHLVTLRSQCKRKPMRDDSSD